MRAGRWQSGRGGHACVVGGARLSFYQYSQPSSPHPCRAGAGACALLRWGEWPLGVRVTMAGYEYVSAEQLAGFDKYKVARRAPRAPRCLPVPASPGRRRTGAVRVTLRRVAQGGLAGRRFSGAGVGGSRGVLGPWVRRVRGHPRLAAPTPAPSRIALAFGDRSARGEPENPLRFVTSSSLFPSASPREGMGSKVLDCLHFNDVPPRLCWDTTSEMEMIPGQIGPGREGGEEGGTDG